MTTAPGLSDTALFTETHTRTAITRIAAAFPVTIPVMQR